MKFDNGTLYKIQSNLKGTRYTLFELANWKNGLAFKKINFSETGVPIIKISELNNGIGATTAYTEQVFSDDVHLHKGDLLFSWSGNPQTSIDIFRFKMEEGWLNQHIFKVTPNEKLVNIEYFYYVMKYLKPYFKEIATNKQTTGLGHVTVGDIKRLNLVIPDLEIQRRIVSVLKPIDDRISCNSEINDNLLAQAREIAKQWISANTDDYEMLSLSDTASINPDTYSLKEEWEYVNYLDTSSITDGCIAEIQCIITSFEKLPSRARRKLAPNDIVFSTVRPNQRHFGIISEPLPNMLCSTGFAVIRSKNPSVCNELIYLCLTENKFVEEMQQLAEQSTSTFPSIKPSDLGACEIPCPKDNSSLGFTEKLKSMFALIAANQRENSYLADMRDALLPKLISGEIDVSSIQL